MGFIREGFGRATVESRRESFILHMDYGYDETGNVESDRDGFLGVRWRNEGHPEFLTENLDDIIAALRDYRESLPAEK